MHCKKVRFCVKPKLTGGKNPHNPKDAFTPQRGQRFLVGASMAFDLNTQWLEVVAAKRRIQSTSRWVKAIVAAHPASRRRRP